MSNAQTLSRAAAVADGGATALDTGNFGGTLAAGGKLA